MFLTKEQILAAKDLVNEVVDIPEWPVDGEPGKVIVRELTLDERGDIISETIDVGGVTTYKDIHAKIVMYSCVDEAGERLFDAADIEALRKKSPSALNRILDVAMRLSKLEAGAVEREQKNLPEGQSEDSSSG